MKNTLLALVAGMALSGAAIAQVGTTLNEGSKATAEKAKEIGDDTKAAVSSEPKKSVEKTKAHVHKAKAHAHAGEAKDAAKDTTR